MKKIVVLISGNGSNLQAIIDEIKFNNINASIECVISNNKDAYGLIRAQKSNINTKVIDHRDFNSREDFDTKLLEEIQKYETDMVVLAGFMRILSPVITSKLLGRIINIHPSLLPKYPGLNTHAKVLENKDVIHGISIHYVNDGLDEGPLIAQGEISIAVEDDIDSITTKIHEIEHNLFPNIINLICSDLITLKNNKVIYKDGIELNHKNIIYKKYNV